MTAMSLNKVYASDQVVVLNSDSSCDTARSRKVVGNEKTKAEVLKLNGKHGILTKV